MNIEIEDYNLDAAFLTCDFFVDGIYHAEQYPLEDFEAFVIANDLLDWSQMVFKNNEYVDDLEGRYEFNEWCGERLSSAEVKLFLESKNH